MNCIDKDKANPDRDCLTLSHCLLPSRDLRSSSSPGTIA